MSWNNKKNPYAKQYKNKSFFFTKLFMYEVGFLHELREIKKPTNKLKIQRFSHIFELNSLHRKFTSGHPTVLIFLLQFHHKKSALLNIYYLSIMAK
jgi:hypothetical protein